MPEIIETTEIERRTYRARSTAASGPMLFDVVISSHKSSEGRQLADTYSVQIGGRHAYSGFASHLVDGLPPLSGLTDVAPIVDDDVSSLPRGNDYAELCEGTQLTMCCGTFATFHDATLCCKACWAEVGA